MNRRALPVAAGLCAACRHGRWIDSARSAYLRCGLSDRDPAYPRYPRLPVLRCPGFEPRPAGPADEGLPRPPG